MVVQVATKRIQLPRKGGSFLRLCRGLEGPFPELSAGKKVGRFMALRALERMGFAAGYFHDDFCSGAAGALHHLADDLLPASQRALHQRLERIESGSSTLSKEVRSTTPAPVFDAALVIEKLGSGFEVALRGQIAEGVVAFGAEGLELVWDIEEVTDASLGDIQIVYGVRRSSGAPVGEWAAGTASYGGHKIVFRGQQRRVMCQDGATLFVDAYVTARQTVSLTRRDNGEVIMGHFEDAALHRVRMEAELVSLGSSSPLALSFDDDIGWTVADINELLGGNCIVARLPKAE